MRAGQLNKRVTIEVQTATGGGVGETDPDAGWSAFLTDWADIRPLSGRELIAAAAVQNVATHRVCMRFRTGIRPGMRVKYGSRYFNIISPARNLEEAGKEMEFEVEEGLVNG